MSLQLTSPPTQEPVSLAEAKAWLRVESGTDEDDLITSLIAAARVRCEWHCGRAFAAQGWMLWLDGVDAVTLYAAGDTAAVLDASGYQVDAPGGRLIFASPHPGLRAVNACSIAFTAGYGVGADVPAPIKSAILQTIAWLYEHRGGDAAPVPDGALALLAPYRVTRL